MKILHLGFNFDISNELYYISEKLDINLIFKKFTDGVYENDSKLYNIGHERAELAWKNNKNFYNKFDIIIISDTCPISRVFLQNNYKQKLIIYVCNRFDYYDQSSLDCDFPDDEYYNLIKSVIKNKKIKILSSTDFEPYYAKFYHNINIGYNIIKPIGKTPKKYIVEKNIFEGLEPTTLFFVPSHHNNNILIDLSYILNELKIPNYSNHDLDNKIENLKNFKGIIHIPHSWSNISFFKAMQLGIIYFIPTMNFLLKLKSNRNFYWTPPFNIELLFMSEWYCSNNKNLIIYFDSWIDLRNKIKNTNYIQQKTILKQFADTQELDKIEKWYDIIYNWN